jgi:hypothetical protein
VDWKYAMGSKQQNSRSIRGVLHAEDKDACGIPSTLKFITVKDDIFIVEQNRTWSELLKYEKMSLAVKGKLRPRIDGKTVIAINQFQLLGNDDG